MKIDKVEQKLITTLIFGIMAFAFLSEPINNLLRIWFPTDITRILVGLVFIFAFFWVVDGGK